MPSWRSASRISPASRAYHRQFGRMKITQLRWYCYRIPFRASFTTVHGVMAAREGIIVQVTTEQGITGIGEIAPLPDFGGGSLADADAALPMLAARLEGKTVDEALALVLAWGQAGAQDASASAAPVLCGLEIALLDALGKAEGCGVSTLLSPAGTAPRAAVAVNAVIGATTTGAAVAAAQEAVKQSFRCVKLKVGLGREHSRRGRARGCCACCHRAGDASATGCERGMEP